MHNVCWLCCEHNTCHVNLIIQDLCLVNKLFSVFFIKSLTTQALVST